MGGRGLEQIECGPCLPVLCWAYNYPAWRADVRRAVIRTIDASSTERSSLANGPKMDLATNYGVHGTAGPIILPSLQTTQRKPLSLSSLLSVYIPSQV